MVKGALWLVQEVGEGGTFTKQRLRTTFPDATQADRRIRDLRSYGWVIHSSVEDASLMPEEQRFVTAGLSVWIPEERRKGGARAIPAKEREEVLRRDHYMCTECGISGGETYADDSNQSAVLSVTRQEFPLSGRSSSVLVTRCKRCAAGTGGLTTTIADALQAVRDLGPEDSRRLELWIDRGRRGSTSLERAWSAYRLLPLEARADVRAALRG